ncbi:MAG: arsenate reductase (glutaredoxin) [Planctomycetaceae bacterium]
MNITIYHYPACSKSRKTLELLEAHGVEPRIVRYLEDVPDKATILRLASLLQSGVAGLLRTNEPAYREAGALPTDDDDAMAEWLTQHPIVLQRPVVVDEDRALAVIGRPPENVLELLSK